MATVNKNFRIKDGLIVEGTTGSINGYDIFTAANTTDDIAEGTTNLFFTAQRAQDAVSGEIGTMIGDAIALLTTSDIEEGTNLYFTNQRAFDAVETLFQRPMGPGTGINVGSYVGPTGPAEISINRSVVDTWYDAAGAASIAEGNANTYTDSAISTAVSGLAPNYVTSVAGSLQVVDGELSLTDTVSITQELVVGNGVDGSLSVKNANGDTTFLADSAAQSTHVTGEFMVLPTDGGYNVLEVDPSIATVYARNQVIVSNDNTDQNITINGNDENITFYNTATENNVGGIGTDGSGLKVDANTGNFTVNVPNGDAIINPDGYFRVYSTAIIDSNIEAGGSITTGGNGNGNLTVKDASANNLFNVYADSGSAAVEFHGTQTLYAGIGDGGTQYGRLYYDGGANLVIEGSNNDIILTSDSGYAYIGSNSSPATRIATQAYVDGVAQGLNIKLSVKAAANSYADLGTIVDGVTLVTGDRVLAIANDQNDGGIYVATVVDGVATFVRSDDQQTPEVGDFVFIETGTTHGRQGWILTTILNGYQVWSQFSAAGEYTAGTGITLDGNAISVTANTYDTYGAAGTAESNANSYTDTAISGLSTVYDALGAAGTAETNAKTYADNNFVTLDSLPGQLDNYVPTSEKGAALGVATLDASGYVPASQLNIDVTGDISTAINALTTDDIEEGSTNLYYTDARAYDAVNGTSIGFTEVTIASVAKQVAATTSVATASTVTALSWAKADFVSAKLFVKAVNATDSQVSEVLVTLDSSDNIAVTEFGLVYTAGELATVTADVSGADVRIRVTTAGSSTDVTVFGTLLV